MKCENTFLKQYCTGEDIKLVVRKTESKNGVCEFGGKPLPMCKECRKNNNGQIKFFKVPVNAKK